MFDPNLPPGSGSKGTVRMVSLTGGTIAEQARPKCRITAKDKPRDTFDDLCLLPDDRMIVGYTSRYISSPCGLQVRSGRDLSLDGELPDAAPPFHLQPGGKKLLTQGPLWVGFPASTQIVDLRNLAIEATLPLRPPFQWLSDQRFIAQLPAFPTCTDKPYVDPDLIGQFPDLAHLVKKETDTRLVILEVSRKKVVNAVRLSELDRTWPEAKHLDLSRDGETLYFASEKSVGAVSLANFALRWSHQLGGYVGGDFVAIYAMALNQDGSYLAAGGLVGSDNLRNSLVMVDVRTGSLFKQTPLVRLLADMNLGEGTIRALAWHPAGWLAAGTTNGYVAHLDLDGNIRAYKGAAKTIEGLCFINDGKDLAVSAREKQLRIWPLLADEVSAG